MRCLTSGIMLTIRCHICGHSVYCAEIICEADFIVACAYSYSVSVKIMARQGHLLIYLQLHYWRDRQALDFVWGHRILARVTAKPI